MAPWPHMFLCRSSKRRTSSAASQASSLLLVARLAACSLRLDAAWWVGVVIAAVSFVLAVPKGVAFAEAGGARVPARRAALVAPPASRARRACSRKRSPSEWLLAVAAALIASDLACSFFAYDDIDYANDLWWLLRVQRGCAALAAGPRRRRAAAPGAGAARCYCARRRRRLTAPTPSELDQKLQ